MAFPLYDLFQRQALAESTLSMDKKRQLIALIKELDKDGKDNLYLLVRYAAVVEKNESVFGAKYQRKGVVFDLDLFSDELQKIIYLFVIKHKEETSTACTEIVFA